MSPTNSLYFSAPIFPRKLVDTRRNGSHSFFSSPWGRLLNISSLKSLRICGPTKTPSLIFATLSRGNFSARYWNADPVRSMAFTKFSSDRIWCEGAVAGFCAILPVLDVAHFSLRPLENSSEANVSSGNEKYLLLCPIHIQNSNTSYILIGDPLTETLLSGHHKYASHSCCIQAFSAAALDFHRFLSCGQRVRLEWMDVGLHYAGTPPSDSVSKSL